MNIFGFWVFYHDSANCLWQIMWTSDIPFDKWMELDMEYIDRRSLWFDLKILLNKIPVVLKVIGENLKISNMR